MGLPVRPHLDAEPELLDAVSYYAERSPAAAIQFLDVIDAALAQIADMPHSAPAWPRAARILESGVARTRLWSPPLDP